MRYKVELAQFYTIEVEAQSDKDAKDKVAVMDDEDIIRESIESEKMCIWQVTKF